MHALWKPVSVASFCTSESSLGQEFLPAQELCSPWHAQLPFLLQRMSLPPKGIEDKTHPKNLPANPESGPSLANRMCSPGSGFLGNRYSFANREPGCWARGRQAEDTEKGPGSGRPAGRGSAAEVGRGERLPQRQSRTGRDRHSRKTRERAEGGERGHPISPFAVFTHAHVHVHTSTRTSPDTHRHTRTDMSTYTHMYTCTNTHTHTCTHTHIQKYARAHTHTRTYIYTHTHKHRARTHTPRTLFPLQVTGTAGLPDSPVVASVDVWEVCQSRTSKSAYFRSSQVRWEDSPGGQPVLFSV